MASQVHPEPSEAYSEGSTVLWWQRAWSVQSIIALLCLVCILLTASATEVMNTVTCDSALEDTRDTMDESTTAIDKKAQESLTRVSSEMMIYITNGVLRLIDKHMQGALEESDRTNDLLQSELRDVPKNSTEWLSILSPRLLHQVSTCHPGAATLAISIFGGDYGVIMALSARHNIDLPGLTTTDITSLYFKPNFSAYASIQPFTGEPILDDPTRYFKLQMSVPDLELVSLARSPMLQFDETVFPVIAPISNFVGYALTSRRHDHSGSNSQMEVAIFIGLGEIQDYLKDVTLSAARLSSNAIIRAYTSIASTWMAERMKQAGAPGWEQMDQTGLLTGVSAGDSTEQYWGVDSMFGFERNLYKPRWATNATDPYIKAVAIALGGNYSTYYNKSELIDVLVNGTVSEKHFVSVERLYYPANGLDWWLTVSIDGESVLGDVQRETVKVNAGIAEKKDDVADEVEEKKMLQRVIIVVIGVALVVLSAVTSWYLLRPVKALQRSMELVANMELDEIEISKSTFYELRLMQRDFSKMIENLVEFRAYVPSSVLESGGYSGEGGRSVVAPPTGHVAIVFTDIRGSTALWKASAADMNVAMEIHNEVMRDACVAHKGYEVKTIGDAFMVSFSSAVAAANFALDVQTNLASQKWPSGLDLPEAGLVVRIGINYGATIAEENPVTGRVDYRGSTVNLASRVEAKALPGTVCITTDMYAAIKGNLDKVNNPITRSMGQHEIKGLGAGHELFSMVPTYHSRRLSAVETDTKARSVLSSSRAGEDVLSIPGVPMPPNSVHSFSVEAVSTRLLEQAKRTALHVQKTSVTVAVCRLVCAPILIMCHVSPTAPMRKGVRALRQLQHHGACRPRGCTVHRRCDRERDRLHNDYHVERIEALSDAHHCSPDVRI